MASARPPKPSTFLPPKVTFSEEEKKIENITPREFLDFIVLGTGKDIDPKEYIEFIHKTPSGSEIVAGARARIERLTGIPPVELGKIAKETAFERTKQAEKTRRKIRATLVSELSFLKGLNKSNRESELKKLCKKGNDYINEVISQYFANNRGVLPNNEVTVCDDPAELMVIAFNDEASPKLKFEAARKLFLMHCFGELANYSEAQADHTKALDYMMGFLNRKIYKLPEGSRIGETFSRYLISEHDEHDFRTLTTKISEEEVEPERPNIRVTHLPSRRTIVKNAKSDQRVIHFSVEPRDKTLGSRLTKSLRYNTQIGEKDVDRNGIRFVFEKHKDWLDFFSMFKNELLSEIADGLKERLEDEKDKETKEVILYRLRNIEQSIIIHSVKDSLDGTEFKAACKSGSPKLEVLKFKVTITLPDGRQYPYEFQVFLPGGYADATYRKGVSWEEYNVDRFFEEGVDKKLFPEKIYSRVDRAEIREKMMKLAHRKVWNGMSA